MAVPLPGGEPYPEPAEPPAPREDDPVQAPPESPPPPPFDDTGRPTAVIRTRAPGAAARGRRAA